MAGSAIAKTYIGPLIADLPKSFAPGCCAVVAVTTELGYHYYDHGSGELKTTFAKRQEWLTG